MFTTPQTPIQGMHVSKSVAYLMRKTEEGYEVLGKPGKKPWPKLYRYQEQLMRCVRKDAALMEIRGQPFF